jgi:hypothetical protein
MMTDLQRLETLEARLRQTEARLRVVHIGWVLSLVLVLLLSTGARQVVSQSPMITAREIRLTDDTGEVRMLLGVSRPPGAGPFIILLGPSGEIRMLLGVSELSPFPAEPAIALFSGSTKSRISLSTTGGSPGLHMYDEAEQGRVLLTASNRGKSGLVLSDSSNKTRFDALIYESGAPILRAFDAAGRPRLMLGTGDDGNPVILMLNSSGNRVFRAP